MSLRCTEYGIIAALLVGGCQLAGLGHGSTMTAGTAGTSSTPSAASSATDGDNGTITIPDVTGLTKAPAEAKLRAAGVRGEITASGGDDGTVCGTTPGAGRESRGAFGVDIAYCGGASEYHKEAGPPDLSGLSVEEATARAKAAGFNRRVEVIQMGEFRKACKPDKVCMVTPNHWELNTEPLTLYMTKKTNITIPAD